MTKINLNLKHSRGFDYACLIAALILGVVTVLALRQPWAIETNDLSLWAVLILMAVLGGVALMRMDKWLPEGSRLPQAVGGVSRLRRNQGLICFGIAAALIAWVVIRLWPNYTNWDGTVLPWLGAILLVILGGWLLGDQGKGRGAAGHKGFFDLPIPLWVEIVGFLLIAALAIFMRTYRLDLYPSGIYVDETNSGLDALRILEGNQVSPFATGWYGTPNGYIYVMAFMIKVFGANYWTLKAISIVPAVLMVLAVYPLGRMMFGPLGGLSTMLFLAVNRWSLSMSRFGWNETAVPVFQILATYFLLRGLRERRFRDYTVGGLLAGLMMYIYLSNRLALATMGLFAVYWILADPEGPIKSFKRNIAGLLVFAFATLIVVAPLAVTYIRDPFTFSNRVEEISVFKDVKDAGNLGPLWLNVQDTLRMFHQVGDHQGKHNLPYEPEMDPITGVLFVIGLAYAAFRLRDRRRGLLWMWLLLGLVGGVFSSHHESPQSYRTLTALPAIMLLAGDTLSRALRGAYRVIPPALASDKMAWSTSVMKGLGVGVFLIGLVGSAGWEANVFFGRQVVSLMVQDGFNLTENQVAKEVINDLKNDKPVYVSPRFFSFSPVQFLVYGYMKSAKGINTLDNPPYMLARPEDNLPVPSSGKDVEFLLDTYYEPVESYFKTFYPNATFELVQWADQLPLYIRVHVPAGDLEAIQGLNYHATDANGNRLDGTAADVSPVDASLKGSTVEWDGSLRVDHSGTYDFEPMQNAQISLDGKPWTGSQFICNGLHKLQITQQDAGAASGDMRLAWKTPDGNVSEIPANYLFKIDPPKMGLTGTYYEGAEWQGDPICEKSTPFFLLAWPDQEPVPGPFSAKYKGFLRIDKPGEYRLIIHADDGARLILDGQTVAEGLIPDKPNDLDVTVVLSQGDHPIEIDYFQGGGGSNLVFNWRPPDSAETVVPMEALIPAQ